MCGMLQLRGQMHLAQESLVAERASELRAEDLDRDKPLLDEIPREHDRRHAASSQLAFEDVSVADYAHERHQVQATRPVTEGPDPHTVLPNGGCA